MRIFGSTSYSQSWLVSQPMASRSLSTAATKYQPNIRKSSSRRFMRYGWQLTSVLFLNSRTKPNDAGEDLARCGLVHQLPREAVQSICLVYGTKARDQAIGTAISTNQVDATTFARSKETTSARDRWRKACSD